jgi:hypothetical protein
MKYSITLAIAATVTARPATAYQAAQVKSALIVKSKKVGYRCNFNLSF